MSVNLESFLWYGFSIDPAVRSCSVIDVAALDPGAVRGLTTFDQYAAEGARRLRALVGTALERAREPIVVPLSGGLDSRGLLATALEYMDASKIRTYTYGLPGTYDFELGQHIARTAGTSHVAINFEKYRYDIDQILDFTRRRPSRGHIFHCPPVSLIEQELGIEGTCLSGFAADFVVTVVPETWPNALQTYASVKRFTRSLNPLPPGADPVACLPREPILDRTVLSYYNQLVVFLTLGLNVQFATFCLRMSYVAPYVEPAWFNYLCYAPQLFRKDRALLAGVVERINPKLAAIPTKWNRGLPHAAPQWRVLPRRAALKLGRVGRELAPFLPWRTSPGSNYLDFDLALRERQDLKEIVRQSLTDLKRRGIVDWLDLDGIWRRHQRRLANHGDALTMLASLEINLKVLEGSA